MRLTKRERMRSPLRQAQPIGEVELSQDEILSGKRISATYLLPTRFPR